MPNERLLGKIHQRNQIYLHWTKPKILIGRSVARKFSIGGLCVCPGGVDIEKLTKTQLIIVWELGALYGETKPPVVTELLIGHLTAITKTGR